MKRIVLCSDGTGNIGGKGRGTNVWRIYKAVDHRGHENDPPAGPEQIAVHDDGVGTSDFKVFKAIGGMAGWGLSNNIRGLYRALVSCYEPGDSLYLFGFSRGAFTIRSLAGMIWRCGIVDSNKLGNTSLDDRVAEAYVCYRKTVERSAAFRAKYAVHHPTLAPEGHVPIHFVGVWDTVDALGVPFDWLRGLIYQIARTVRRPHDADLNPSMVHGYHAMAIDDERRTFDPVMWDERTASEGQHIEQVWFAGVHSNVGGGYPRQGMSSVALDWMMAKAEQSEPSAWDHGLRFIASERARAREEADAFARLYDSRAGMAAYFRYRPREIGKSYTALSGGETKVHVTALQRIARATDAYAPGALPVDFTVVTTEATQDAMAAQFAGKLAASRNERSAARALVERLVGVRVALYYIFLSITLLTASLTVYFRLAERFDILPRFAGFFPAFNAALSTPPEGAALPVRIGAAIYGLIPAGLNGLIPASWEPFIDGLFARADVVFIIAALLGVLLFIRQRVKGQMRRVLQASWKKALG